MDDFLHRLHAHDWASEPRSEWHAPEDVPRALVAAWRGDPDAYDRLMAVLAHDHSGALYPVLLPAMAFLHEILMHSPEVGVDAVLGLLDDFVYSFGFKPEPLEVDRPCELAFREALLPIRQTAVAIAATRPVHADMAADLVAGIDARLAGAWDR
ncbi:MAG TPA: hypothetical protein VIP05_27475 [Burkholderiaceae bacterium]